MSSTLDSRWATTTDRKKADEGLPSTRYTAALRVNNDLHPESTSTVATITTTTTTTTSSSTSSPTTTSLDSRWATSYDSYKAERGIPATKYSESIANTQINLHPKHEQEKQQPSVKWGNYNNRTVEQKQTLDDQRWWRPESNSNNDKNNNDSSSRYHDFSREQNNSYDNQSKSSRFMNPYPTPMDSSNSRYSYNNNNKFYDQQQQQSRDVEKSSLSYPSSSIPSHSFSQQQQQPAPRQYEPISSRPWNLIALKKKEEIDNITAASTTPSSSAPDAALNGVDNVSQEQQQSHISSAENAYNDDNLDDIINSDIPVTSFKTYKEWSEEQRQKSAIYTEGNELLEILSKGRNGQDRYENNDNNNDYNTSTTTKTIADEGASAAWSDISRNNKQSRNYMISSRATLKPTNDESTWNNDNRKSLGDKSTVPRQSAQKQLPNIVGTSNSNKSPSNIAINYNDQDNRRSTPTQDTAQQGYNTANPAGSTPSSTWDPNEKIPWNHDDSGTQQFSYNTTQHNNTPSQDIQNYNTSPAMPSEYSSSWNNNRSSTTSPPPNNTLSQNTQIYAAPPIISSASSSSWDPNAPKPWDEPSSQPNNNSQRNPISPVPSHGQQVAENRNSNDRNSWNQVAGSRSIRDIQNNSDYSSEYNTKAPTGQRQFW
ncbi:hypothetical protein INT45_001803 [Circinella minor]|uniref:Uncharacterized protein n=1 Tax=Circinella minor TaxID=1195481 RepID=A0A8H7RX60_9FUNG|nr:hypothetical protein INT45_001803 [Circinella minor]